MSYDRNKYLLKKYNLTPEQFNALYEKQKGCCAICGRHESELSRPLVVDHQHKKNGKVRGLLCVGDNWRLGVIKENIVFLRGSIAYLEEAGYEDNRDT